MALHEHLPHAPSNGNGHIPPDVVARSAFKDSLALDAAFNGFNSWRKRPWRREHRFDDAPFAVAQFIPHDSMLHFESLNHAQDQGINGQTACPLLEGERTCGGHREIDAIDPLRKSGLIDSPTCPA
jgi:hypothetical protein